jgi:hypothetical protein
MGRSRDKQHVIQPFMVNDAQADHGQQVATRKRPLSRYQIRVFQSIKLLKAEAYGLRIYQDLISHPDREEGDQKRSESLAKLYVLLNRQQDRQRVASVDGHTKSGRPVKTYTLTEKGETLLAQGLLAHTDLQRKQKSKS